MEQVAAAQCAIPNQERVCGKRDVRKPGSREPASILSEAVLIAASRPRPPAQRLPARAPRDLNQRQSNTTQIALHPRQKTMTGATCFVCAKPANLRCSACAGKVEVSFCSK